MPENSGASFVDFGAFDNRHGIFGVGDDRLWANGGQMTKYRLEYSIVVNATSAPLALQHSLTTGLTIR